MILLTLDSGDFTWDFIFEVSTWPMAHMFNPFMIEILLQNPLLTLLIVWSWESVEVLAVTVFNGSYLVFVADNSEGFEGITDSQIGDVLQGVLGMILARVVIVAWRIPPWAPSIFGPYRALFFKRVLQYFVFVLPLVFTNSVLVLPGCRHVNWGIFVILPCTMISIHSWYLTGMSPLELELFWKDRTELERRSVYVGVMLNAFALLSSTFVFVWVPYFQVWTMWLILMLWNFLIIIDTRPRAIAKPFRSSWV